MKILMNHLRFSITKIGDAFNVNASRKKSSLMNTENFSTPVSQGDHSVNAAWKRPSADTTELVTFAALNGKLKFVFEISTSTSLALPKVTAFLVVVSHLGRMLTLQVPSSSCNLWGQLVAAQPLSNKIHTSLVGRSSISAIMHTPKITVDIQSLVLLHDLTLYYKC